MEYTFVDVVCAMLDTPSPDVKAVLDLCTETRGGPPVELVSGEPALLSPNPSKSGNLNRLREIDQRRGGYASMVGVLRVRGVSVGARLWHTNGGAKHRCVRYCAVFVDHLIAVARYEGGRH